MPGMGELAEMAEGSENCVFGPPECADEAEVGQKCSALLADDLPPRSLGMFQRSRASALCLSAHRINWLEFFHSDTLLYDGSSFCISAHVAKPRAGSLP